MRNPLSKQPDDGSLRAPAQRQGSTGNVEPSAATPSSNRKSGVAALASDTRSFLTPSFASSSYKSPIRPAASPSATSTISTSSAARSPSAQGLNGQEGAAARLRRVASNASFQAVKSSHTASTPTQNEAEERKTEVSPPHVQADATAPEPEPPGKGDGGSNLVVPEIGTKRPLPGGQQRPSQPSRSPSRRKTWFGWTASEQQPDGVSSETPAEQSGPEPRPREPSQVTSGELAQAETSGDQGPAQLSRSSKPTATSKVNDAGDRQASWSMWRAASAEPLRKKEVKSTEPVPQGAKEQEEAPLKAQENETSSVAQAAERLVSQAAQSVTPGKKTNQDATGATPGGNVPAGEAANAANAESSKVQHSGLWSYWPGSWSTSGQSQVQKKTDASSKDIPEQQQQQQHDATPKNSSNNPMGTRMDTVTDDRQEQPVSDIGKTVVAAPNGWTSWLPYVGQPSGNVAAAPVQDDSGESAVEAAKPLSPAEEVKRAALARPDPSPPVASSSSLEPSSAVLNTATRSSWLAYFATRAAHPASRITGGQPEAMEVDFEEMDVDPPAASAGVKGSAAAPKTKKPATVHSGKAASTKSTPAPSISKAKANGAPKPDPAPPTDEPTTPLTEDKGKAKEVAKKASKQSKKQASSRPPLPNLVLPSFDDTFRTLPRSIAPPAGVLKRTLSAMNAWLSSSPPDAARLRTAPKVGKNMQKDEAGLALAEQAAVRLPRTWDVVGQKSRSEKRGCQNVNRVVVITCHGWFAQSKFSMLMGSPTGTSQKFALEMRAAIMRHFQSVDGMELNPEAITLIPLSADGTVEVRTDASFAALLSRKEWVTHLAAADAIFVACHSQGCVVGANLLARLIEQSYIQTRKTRIALLAMCGIHEGPFQHIQSMLVSSYLTYFETEAAQELFAFQSSSSQVSKRYQASMRLILEAGAKVVLLASTDDQVVPLHSALFTSIDHPSILRALYIHGNTFPKLDFLTNVLAFCVRVRNAGLSDHQLLALLSVTVAGSLYGGAGHSLCYDEPKAYDLVVRYLFETTHPLSEPTTRSDESRPPKLDIQSFEAPSARRAQLSNPHLLPWSLRGLLEDRAVRATFSEEIQKLHDDFESWKPLTKTLKDVQYRLEPMRSIARPRIPPPPSPTPSNSKL
ncbi:hypothetical protein BCV69DRAFT_280953 [Microstroma glucosiphilum]|uniref:YMC020W-like alpha/beta hydrolase domain-containing protein n=1 Tax=Pseudomicrostroma glucosiphilum TaxID=1684307 RepID=A0A316UJF9_9BASI|nr:hypothetical protein BCV69DRAFT_280953 [Pseudomicrostroma glucosiphilum]PWN23345.1 hypothetical protein BCV69DRAFT_280953 [Pseudomicrostroma glucosiphilum]